MAFDVCTLLREPHPDQQKCAYLADWVNESLSSGNFSVVLNSLRQAVQQVDSIDALRCLLTCLLWCQHAVVTPVVQHLLLEAIPADTAAAANNGSTPMATQLLQDYCNNGNGKLASKVASTFGLRRGDLTPEGWQQLTSAVQLMLQQPCTYKPAVFLMMQFEGLDEAIDRSEVLTQLVADGQDTLAQQWATSLGKDYQIAFVEACLALDRLKPAARAVRQLGLVPEFPKVEAMYRQRSLTRLMNKRLWPVAQSYAGNDVALQTQLVQGMAAVGELVLAEEYRLQAGLTPDTLAPPDPAELAAQEAARREAYLQLNLPADAVLWVDDAEGCAAALQQLAGSDVMGLDVEWKPSHVAGVASPAALLQVANRTCVVLFDLLTLCQHHPAALESCLGPLLSGASVLKVGFEVAGDLSKLAGSWPGVQAFRQVVGVLDLRPLWVAYGVANTHQGGSARALSSVGLSTLCSSLLGKPLDKSQQMSDWSSRPLTARQQQYAALDAFVLPQLYDVLCERLGSEVSQRLVAQNTKTLSRPTPTPSPTDAKPVSSNQQQSRQGPIQAATVPPASQAAAGSTSHAPEAAGSQLTTGGGVAGGPQEGSATAASLSCPGEGRVKAVLQQHGMQDRYQGLHMVRSAGSPHVTAWDTAAAVGVPTGHVAKTMTLLVNQQPYLVATRGDQRIDMHKLAALLGVKRRAITIAPEATVSALTGFTSGVPPVGCGDSATVILDQRLAALAGTVAAADPGGQAAPMTPALNPASTGLAGASAATTPPTAADVLPPSSSRLYSGSRGSLGIVAAIAATPAEQQPTGSGPEQPCRPFSPNSSSAAPADSAAEGGFISTIQSTSPLLAVQCGPNSVLRVTFDELLQLSGTGLLLPRVADVADAPAEAAAVSTVTGAAAGGSGQHSTPSQPKFLLDSMLGRLCRWLRALGVDAEFVEPGHQGNAQPQSLLIQHIQEAALLQGRLFVTLDQKLAMRRDVGGSVYLLNSNDPAGQLAELSRHFGIRLDESILMSRCGNCNAAAFRRISHEEAAVHVNAKLLELVEEFWQCGKCGKVVWMGPKSYAAINLLEGLFADGTQRPTPLQSQRKWTVTWL